METFTWWDQRYVLGVVTGAAGLIPSKTSLLLAALAC